jgi:hypothetical protein
MLMSEPSTEILKPAFDSATLDKIDALIVAFGASHPGIVDIQEDVLAARRNLGSVSQR